jgi:hypothetical protein
MADIAQNPEGCEFCGQPAVELLQLPREAVQDPVPSRLPVCVECRRLVVSGVMPRGRRR